jgi:hypothetical protein
VASLPGTNYPTLIIDRSIGPPFSSFTPSSHTPIPTSTSTSTIAGGWADVREALKAKAEALGFARARVTTPEPAARLGAYKAWVAEGKHGTMG